VRVFLLDDHELVRRGIRELLWAHEDMTVVGEASTAEEALARIPPVRPHVAVLDVRLPDGDGARFWASIATHDRSSDRYEILRVIGPDEYHHAYPDAAEPGLDNNSYTNVMAVWVLRRALDVLNLLPEPRHSELREALDLRAAELSRWEEIIRKMRVVFHDDGVISQFEGYQDLKELDWDTTRLATMTYRALTGSSKPRATSPTPTRSRSRLTH
jgi:CheY-like chemotaxis protein